MIKLTHAQRIALETFGLGLLGAVLTAEGQALASNGGQVSWPLVVTVALIAAGSRLQGAVQWLNTTPEPPK